MSEDSGGTVEDGVLIAAINRGDPTAFEVLYDRYRDWVVNLAFRFTRDREEAFDVLQEAFAYLARKAPGLRLTGKMTSFLYPVVRNLSLTAAAPERTVCAGFADRGERSGAGSACGYARGA